MKPRGAARIRKILEAGKDQAFLSRDLATVKRDVRLDTGLPAERQRWQSFIATLTFVGDLQ